MNIVLFDGICNFCNSTVLQIIKYDKANKLKFSSLQSDFGKKTLKSLKMEEDNLNTLIFIKNSNEVYTESTAILEIIKMLQGFQTLIFYANRRVDVACRRVWLNKMLLLVPFLKLP